ncbi:hypothetical protein [Microbacterium sp.]|jgi:hypothetical protein|uniref:hypothetical protein n=1 Tax=Microbacterium sp. TaxID=51671 RepID=UPI0026023043|nr:hypothetical protein [Microbacterium sp.]
MGIAYDYDGAAAAIGVAPSKIKTAVREGTLAAKYWGKDVLIEHDELVEFVRALPSSR